MDFKFSDPIYNMTFHVWINIPIADGVAKFNALYPEAKISQEDSHTYALCMQYGPHVGLIFTELDLWSPKDMYYVSHEILHATLFTMSHLDVKGDVGNHEEILAYYNGWITEQFFKGMKKLGYGLHRIRREVK